jgi:putative nucleotidyltransferase with HDIG domain
MPAIVPPSPRKNFVKRLKITATAFDSGLVGISRLPESVSRARPRARQDELISDSLKRDATPLTSDERRVLAVVGGSFLVVATATAIYMPWHRALSWSEVFLVVAVLAVASRTRFVTEAGHTAPIVLVTVPALFMLPPPIVPLVTGVGLALGRVPDVLTRRSTPARPLLGFASAGFMIGPAIILSLDGAPAPTATAVWILVAALASQLLLDLAISSVREALVLGMTARQQLTEGLWVYKIDIALAPVGLLIAIAATEVPWSLLLLVPLLLLMHYFSDERRRRLEQMTELNAAYRGTAMVLGDVVESDDAYTGEHSRGVVQLALEVAQELRLDEQTCRRVDFGAMLHDVGKVAIPKEIINKPGPLDPDEWDIVKTHTTEGQRMLDQVGGLMRNIGLIVRAHHERWDGTGYPDGLRGDEIPIEARIVSACDTWSAMTTTRSYRIAMSREAAMAELQSAAGTQLDPTVVDALIRVIVRNGEHRMAAR